MRTSKGGLELIKSFEGFRETATRLPDGRWTIGYGHVRTAREGLTINPKDAEDLLTYDLKPVEDAVASMIFAPVMQNQFDALVSLAFNISPGQFRDSDILRNLNAGDYLAAANGFDLWRKARIHGRVMIVDALVRRRAAEKALFLEHPTGPPSAPTPIVTPQMDFGAAQPAAEQAARTTSTEGVGQPRPRRDEDEAPARPAPSSDIAEAVRRLAERTQEAVSPSPELPLPLGAEVEPPQPKTEPPAAVVEPQPEPVAPPAPKTPDEIEHARKVVAERVARILERAEKEIEKQEKPATPPVETTAPQFEAEPAPKQQTRNPVPRPRAKDPEVLEGLPDFDEQPAPRTPVTSTERKRALIDDTETFDPGRDPSEIFAEAERKAKDVETRSRRVGPLSGRWVVMAPWILVLILSVLGFAIGLVDSFKDSGLSGGVPRAAATILAVFGMMMLMSLYFIFWTRTPDSET